MKASIVKFIKGALQLADIKIWMMSYIPFTVGILLAVFTKLIRLNGMDILWIVVAYAALGFIETGKNAINEYTDFVSGVDSAVDDAHKTPFSGGKKTIVSGLLTLRQVIWITVLSFLAAGGLGLLIVIFKEFWVLPIGALGILISLLYSIPPIKLCYRGVGEFLVGITFGPLVLSAGYVMLAGTIDVLPILIGVPLGLVIANILLINEYPDYEADRGGNKRNLVVRLGKAKASKVYGILFLILYLFYIAAAIYDMSLFWLLPLITAPMAYKAYKNSIINAENIPKLIMSNAKTIESFIYTGILLFVGILARFAWESIIRFR